MDFMRGIVIWGGVAVASGAAGAVLAGVKNRDYSFVDRLVLRAAAAGLDPAAAAALSGRCARASRGSTRAKSSGF